MEGTNDTLQKIQQLNSQVLKEVQKVIVGQTQIAQLCFVAMLSGGHMLLEGVPGTAKTLLMKTLSHVLGMEFKKNPVYS